MTVPPRFVVTGPTGWIGSALLHALATRLGPDWTRQVTLFGSCERMIAAPGGMTLMRSLDSITGEDVKDARLIHLAYLTRDKVAVLGPSAFFAANTAIDDVVLAACDAGPPQAAFVASSGAARQAETGVGREPYGLCKLMQEDRFLAFGARQSVPVLAARIFNIAGPFINKLDAYAVSALLGQAFRNGVARIEARTPVYRAYLHVGDLAAIVLGALEAAIGSHSPMDLGGPLTVEMEDVAREALRAAGRSPGAIERGTLDWDRPSVYLGDPTGARTLALRLGLTLRSFAEQVDDTASDLVARAILRVDRAGTTPIEVRPSENSTDPRPS